MDLLSRETDFSCFEIIDPKQKCKSIYANGQIIKEPNYDLLRKTWGYHLSLSDLEIEYASLYAQCHTPDDCCPPHLQDAWTHIKEKYRAYLKSFRISGGDFHEECFYDLVPQSFVMDYFKIKNQISHYVLETFEKPSNYKFLVELSHLLSVVRERKLNVRPEEMRDFLHQLKARSFYSKLQKVEHVIDYNIFGTITGRLTTHKNSFPILTMNRDYRRVVQPHNTWFIELDFNAAELRCLLALNEQEQPEQDIHDWHGCIFNKLSDHKLERDEIKRKIFGWLYGPLDGSLGIPSVEKHYNKRKIINKYWDGTTVTNHFGRKIKADEFHALNAIIQSTTSDVFLRRAIAVNKLLKNKKSFTMGLIHDSMVIDFHREDKFLIDEIAEEFGNTELGKFKVNLSLGTHFGNMKRFR